MTTITWSGLTGGDWSDASNWQGGVVPGPSDDAVGSLTATETIIVSVTVSLHSVNFSDPNATLLIQNGSTLITSNNISLSLAKLDVTNGFMSAGGAISLTLPGTTIEPPVACFARGSLIATPDGPVPVETIRPRDQVRLMSGESAQVRWVGYRRVDCRTHPAPQTVQPVRICAGAFSDNIPSQDLLLSPDHALYVNEVLIPVRHLVNGRTIVQQAWESVDYHHIELLRHEVILANDLPVESYLDSGDRAAFSNAGQVQQLHPTFSPLMWEALGCAPLVVTGPVVDQVKADLLARAEHLEAAVLPRQHFVARN